MTKWHLKFHSCPPKSTEWCILLTLAIEDKRFDITKTDLAQPYTKNQRHFAYTKLFENLLSGARASGQGEKQTPHSLVSLLRMFISLFLQCG